MGVNSYYRIADEVAFVSLAEATHVPGQNDILEALLIHWAAITTSQLATWQGKASNKPKQNTNMMGEQR